MSYIKHNFNSGDVLYAQQLNDMDNQIALNEEEIAGKVSDHYMLTKGDEITTAEVQVDKLLFRWPAAGQSPFFEGAGTCKILDVNPGDVYYASGYQYFASICSWGFKLRDGSYRAGDNPNATGGEITEYVSFTDEQIIVPSDAVQLIVNGNGLNDKHPPKIYGAKRTSAFNVIKSWIDDMPTARRELTQQYFKVGIMETTGDTNSSGYRAMYKVTEGDVLYITGAHVFGNFPLYIVLNETYQVIDYARDLDNLTAYTNFKMTVPVGATYLIVNGWPDAGISKPVVVSDRPLSLDDYLATYSGNTQTYKGKLAVFFGTSIPAGEVVRDDGSRMSIPSKVGDILGMTVINEAVGSSAARCGWYTRKTADDPYGWHGLHYEAAFKTLGASLEVKEYLINNYESKIRDMLAGNDKPQTLSDEMKETIRNYSYERKLLPYLDGTKAMPDLFIFEHGYNDKQPDWVSGKGLVTDCEFSDTFKNSQGKNFDMLYYADTMAFFIQTIWKANPKAKILIVSHYNADDDSAGKYIWPAQKTIAETFGLPFCDVAHNIGWTTVPFWTNGYWDKVNQVWINTGGEPQLTNRRDMFLFDTLHPHSNFSGEAIEMEAEIIAKYISSHITL